MTTIFACNVFSIEIEEKGDAGICMFVYACVCVFVCRYSSSARTNIVTNKQTTNNYKNKNHNSSLFKKTEVISSKIAITELHSK